MLNNRNFEYNKKIPQGNGYINGQAKCSVSDMKYGLFTMAYNGCGVIALYNLMFFKGKKMSVADIAREIYPYSSILFGIFGNRMLRICRFFDSHRIKYKNVGKSADTISSFPKYDCCILGLWNGYRNPFKGKHFVFVRNVGGKAVVYNYSSYLTKPKTFDSLEEYLNGRRLTVAYFFE